MNGNEGNRSRPSDSELVIVGGVEFTFADVFTVIDAFYNKIQNDDVLSEPFQSVGDWPEHIDRLTNFWWIRFGGKPFVFSFYSPIPKHFAAGFNEEMLKRWLELFNETLVDELNVQQSSTWIDMASHMGSQLSMRNQMYAEKEKMKYGTTGNS